MIINYQDLRFFESTLSTSSIPTQTFIDLLGHGSKITNMNFLFFIKKYYNYL